MPQFTKPGPPIPEPLRGLEPDTWAHYTVTERMPDIARRVLAENDFPPAIVERMEALIEEIPYRTIRPLEDPTAPDAPDWERYVAPYLGQNWLQVPWFFAEMYFYRRIVEATGYFQTGPGQGIDPYSRQKQQGLEMATEPARILARRLRGWLSNPARNGEALTLLLVTALWGNQADLSIWPAGGAEEQPGHEDIHQSLAHIVVNETGAILEYVSELGTISRVDFLVDNAGFELISDLGLADYLLDSGLAEVVHLHLKAHPTFVSDALIRDVYRTIEHLETSPDVNVRLFAARLEDHLQDGSLRLFRHFYWNSPLSGWEMPDSVRDDLAASRLVISKGDANYRRLLGDRHWPFTTPFEDIVRYFPAPLVALRTFKSELAAGLPPGLPEELSREDPRWLVNGRRGVIQFAHPGRSHSAGSSA